MLNGRAKPAARWEQRRHLPGSASSARGSNTAGGPPHHLLPPPWPRRRLSTAPAAPPTDTTVGAGPPSTRRGPEGWESGAAAAPAPRLGSARGPESAGRGTGSLTGLGHGRRGVCYCRLGLSAAEHAGKQPAGGGATRASAQIRKSPACPDGRGSVSQRSPRLATRLSFPDPGRYFVACLGRPQGERDLLAAADGPPQTWGSPNRGTGG